MIIRQLGLKRFGKFIDKNVDFSEGVNVIYGNNEKGKSTIHQFIESFFSMGKNKNDDKIDRYNPWSTENDFRGEMIVNLKDDSYHLKADFLDKSMRVFSEEKELSATETFGQQTFMNLIGVQDFGMANSKDFIHEIQNKIVNIKNANHMVIHYEEAVRDLQIRMENLRSDAYYLHVETDLANAKDKMSKLVLEIDSLHINVEHLFTLRKRLDLYMSSKQRIIDSIAVEEYEQLVKRISRIDNYNIELDEIKNSIELNELFSTNSMEEVDNYIEDIQDVNGLLRQVEDTSNKIKVLKDKQKELGLTQSDKAIKLMAEDMYANDFITDVEHFIQAERKLKDLESTFDQSSVNEIHAAAEENFKSEKELESDYMRFLNARNNLHQLELQTNNDHEIIANETRLDLVSRRSKPLTIYTGVFAVLLMISLFLILVMPDQALVGGVAAALFAIATFVFVFNKFQNNQEISQLRFVIAQLDDEMQMKQDELEDLNHELNKIFTKYGVVDHITFEQFYIQQKRMVISAEDPKLKMVNIENQINDLTSNKNMLYRRVRKWILDAEIDVLVSVEDKEKIIPIVEAHSRNCVSFMNINNDIFRYEYMVRQNNEQIKESREAINNNEVYNLLITFALDEVKRMKLDFMALEEKRNQVTDEVNDLLKNMSYQQLSEKAKEKELAIEGIDVSNRIPGDKDALQDRLNLVNDNISDTRSEIQDNREIVNDLSIAKRRLIEAKREISRFEDILTDREENFNFTDQSLKSIEAAATFIKDSYTDDLTESVGKVLYDLTGTYDEVQITSDYEFFVKNKDKGRSVPIEQLSKGLLDQLYFAVRVGLMDTVNRQDKTPLVLDDTFVHYDDDRLANVLKVISKLNRQIIILTCQKREMNILDKLNINYTQVHV